MPVNKPVNAGADRDNVLRFLDCAVVNFTLDKLAGKGSVYQTVRGVFVEGGEAYPGAGIMLKSHIQISLRDQHCILGFFRPSANTYSVVA